MPQRDTQLDQLLTTHAQLLTRHTQLEQRLSAQDATIRQLHLAVRHLQTAAQHQAQIAARHAQRLAELTLLTRLEQAAHPEALRDIWTDADEVAYLLSDPTRPQYVQCPQCHEWYDMPLPTDPWPCPTCGHSVSCDQSQH